MFISQTVRTKFGVRYVLLLYHPHEKAGNVCPVQRLAYNINAVCNWIDHNLMAFQEASEGREDERFNSPRPYNIYKPLCSTILWFICEISEVEFSKNCSLLYTLIKVRMATIGRREKLPPKRYNYRYGSYPHTIAVMEYYGWCSHTKETPSKISHAGATALKLPNKCDPQRAFMWFYWWCSYQHSFYSLLIYENDEI